MFFVGISFGCRKNGNYVPYFVDVVAVVALVNVVVYDVLEEVAGHFSQEGH